MRNKLLCFLTMVLSVFSQVSCMLAPVQQQAVLVQFWPKDESKGVKCRLDLQSLGRLAATCSYINNNWQVEDFSKEQFNLVEKCLYFYAPKTLLTDLKVVDVEQIKKRLCSVMSAHVAHVDEKIVSVYKPIQKEYQNYFLEELTLNNEDRIAFYFGKLPGKKPRFINLSEYESDSEDFLQDYGDSLTDDNIDAAYMDASFAVYDCNVERAKAVFNRYNQFPDHGNGLLESLCFLANGPILLDFLSIPERGIECVDADGYTAVQLAKEACGDDALVAFLQQAIDSTKK